MSRTIEILVDTLVFDGVPPVSHDAIASAIASELERLIDVPTGVRQDAASGSPRRQPVPATDPAAIGRAIAGAVHRVVPGSAFNRRPR